MQLRRRKGRPDVGAPRLTGLPDAVLDSIATFLPPRSVAYLQTTCKQLQKLLAHDSLWQTQLEQSHPVWTEAGIQPVSGWKQGQTWKELVETASQCKDYKLKDEDTGLLQAPSYTKIRQFDKTRELWNSGKQQVLVDYGLCYAEAAASMWSNLPATPLHLKAEHIRTMLELVYFLWFEQRQLARGAKMLAKAVSVLLEVAPPEHRMDNWRNSADLTMSYASVAAFLLNLLQIKGLKHSPISISEPVGFLEACQGDPATSECVHHLNSNQFQWCGSSYSWGDFDAALSLLTNAGDASQDLLTQQCLDPWDQASWEVFNQDAVTLLNAVANWQASPEDGGHLQGQGFLLQLPGQVMPPAAQAMMQNAQLHGQGVNVPMQAVLQGQLPAFLQGQMPASMLLHQAAHNADLIDHSKRVALCRAHQLFAGAAFCFRMHGKLDKCITAYAEQGLMYEDARQHQRAAHFYKLAIMTGAQRAWSNSEYTMDTVLIGLAEAYDGEWQDTGNLESYQQAFAWRKFLVQRLVGQVNKTPYERERTCECLHSLGLLLEDHSCRGANVPQLQRLDTHLLAVGAYMLGMRQIDANAKALAWIRGHVEMADAAELAFTAFLNSTPDDTPDPLQNGASTSGAAESGTSPHTSEQPGPSASSAHTFQAPSSIAHALDATGGNTSNGNTSVSSAQAAAAASAPASTSASAPAVPALPPPAELTVKHVGFLGSLAHALVHLQKSAEGLALLRAAAHIMRSSPPNPFVLYHHTPPESQVLHAHVLMDLGVSLLGERLYEEALDIFMEGLTIAKKDVLGDRVLSTFRDHVAHTILQLRQQRALSQFLLSNGTRVDTSWKAAEGHAAAAVAAAQRCKPYEPVLEASPLTTLGDIASAMCLFSLAKSRYLDAFNKLAGDPEQRAALSPSNAAEAATTMAAVADMQLKLGEDEAAAASLDTSLQLLEQFPCQLPALQVKRTELYLTTLQMQIHIFRNDLPGAQHKLQLCIALTTQGAEYRPGFVRYDEALTQAAVGNMQAARLHFEEASAVAVVQQDRQLETMACTALGLLLTSSHFPNLQDQQLGWKRLQRGLELAKDVGDMLCEAHAAEGMLKVLKAGELGKKMKNKRELKRSLQDKVQVITQEVGEAVIAASGRTLLFAGL